MYKIRNKTKTSRRFREHKNAHLHFLRPGEEMTLKNPPITKRTDVFEITDLSQKEEPKEIYENPETESGVSKTSKKKKKRSKSNEVEDDGTTRHME